MRELALEAWLVPLLGAWLIAFVGGWLEEAFNAERPIRLAVMGEPGLASALAHEMATTGVRDHVILGWISDESDVLHEDGPELGNQPAMPRLGTISEIRSVVLEQEIDVLVMPPRNAARRPVPGDDRELHRPAGEHAARGAAVRGHARPRAHRGHQRRVVRLPDASQLHAAVRVVQARARPGGRRAAVPDAGAADGHRRPGGQAPGPRPGAVPPAPRGCRRSRFRGAQVPFHGRRTPRSPASRSGRRPRTRASRPSGASCARRTWTRCPS